MEPWINLSALSSMHCINCRFFTLILYILYRFNFFYFISISLANTNKYLNIKFCVSEIKYGRNLLSKSYQLHRITREYLIYRIYEGYSKKTQDNFIFCIKFLCSHKKKILTRLVKRLLSSIIQNLGYLIFIYNVYILIYIYKVQYNRTLN